MNDSSIMVCSQGMGSCGLEMERHLKESSKVVSNVCYWRGMISESIYQIAFYYYYFMHRKIMKVL